MRFALALAAALLALAFAPRVLADSAGTTISGGDLPRPVRLSPVDEEAFFRRLNVPPKLQTPPDARGRRYTITSRYWDVVLRGDRVDRPPAEAEGLYYAEDGYVRARQGGADVWLVIDLRQRAILDRYVRLGAAGLLTAEPGVLQVLRAAAEQGEQIAIEIGGALLDQSRSASFWEGVRLAALSFQEPPLAPRVAGGVPIVVTVREGRSVEMVYDSDAGTIVDLLGTERYSGSPALRRAVLEAAGLPFQVEQDAGAGSPLWWLLGAAVGASSIAAAVYFSRRWRSRPR